MENKLYYIPGIVVGIKLRDVHIKYFSYNVRIQYAKLNPELPGSLVIADKVIDDIVLDNFNGLTLIEENDSKFSVFDSISDQLNTFKYSYSDIPYLAEVDTIPDDEIMYELIKDELETILEKNLNIGLQKSNISIESLKLV